jgi:hypothetical protein
MSKHRVGIGAALPTPCPGSPGCRCAYCFGLAEYMIATTGDAHGLPITWRPPPRLVEAPKPVSLNRAPAEQPWVPKPPRQLREAA